MRPAARGPGAGARPAAAVLALLLLAAELAGQPKRLQFRRLTPDEGLSSSTVTCILQDSRGFMWIGTYNGLNRYDGSRFTVFRYNSLDTSSVPHNLIWQIFEDRAGTLWIATAAGLARFDWKTDRFIRVRTDASIIAPGQAYGVQSVAEDSSGGLWLGTTVGLVKFDPADGRTFVYRHDPENPASLSQDYIECVTVDSRNRLWVSTRNGLNRFLPETGTFRRYMTDPRSPGLPSARAYFQDIVEDRTGTLWIGSLGMGLFSMPMDAVSEKSMVNYRRRPGDPRSLSGDRVLCLYVDSRDQLWVGTENAGLNLWDRTRRSFWRYEPDLYNPSSLSNNSIHAVFQDRTGNFWIGTFAGGVNVSKFNGDAIIHYQSIPGVTGSLSGNVVTSFAEDAAGRIWIGTDGGGLNRFDSELERFRSWRTDNSNLQSDAVISVCADSRNRLWVGTWGAGLNRFDPDRGAFTAFTTSNSGIPENNILVVKEGSGGRLWLGSFQSGLIRFDPANGSFASFTTRNSGLSNDMISDIEPGPGALLFVGTYFGFNVFDPATGRCTAYHHEPGNPSSLSDDTVMDLMAVGDTTVWVGTMDGLSRFNLRTRTFTRFTREDGLPDNVIKGIVRDPAGKDIWVTTERGVCRFNPLQRRGRTFTRDDGLESDESGQRSVWATRDGRVLCGGAKGFNVLVPERIGENRILPRLIFTDFLIANRRVPVGVKGSPLPAHISGLREITLPYRTPGFTITFAVMDFTIPEKNQYAFRMDGFDRDWIEAGTQSSATYAGLGPGRYVFRVKGANNDGLWNENGASLRIRIRPPWWRTGWFLGAAFIALSALLFAGIRLRLSGERRRNAELEKRIRERTAALERSNRDLEAFSYSVSHDLRAPLRSLNGFSKALIDDWGDRLDETGRDYLIRIRKASERMGLLIDELLKLSRLTRKGATFREVDLGLLAKSIMDETARLHPERRPTFVCADGCRVQGDKPLLALLLRNLIDNAWKFSSRRPDPVIEFGRVESGDGPVFFVRDNGVGFDMAYSKNLFDTFERQHPDFDGTGIGLAMVKRIVDRHGGSVWAEGKVGGGAAFYFTIGRKRPPGPRGD
ncbi:MAG: two-component regulator propeller domain-containing protein [bacterium]|nr:two-component regulator propeller domain-containing protein [bacterium]